MCKQCNEAIKITFPDAPELLDREVITQMDYKLFRWICCIGDCNSGSRIRRIADDLGPMYYWPVRKGEWIDVYGHRLFCHKHYKEYKRRLASNELEGWLPELNGDLVRKKVVFVKEVKMGDLGG